MMRSPPAILSTFLLASVFGFASVLTQDLTERDALCNEDGCFVVYFQRKTFLDSWRACKEKGGNLATIKRKEDATSIASLFSTLDLRHSRTKVQVWIGLQRQPRQCTTTRPLRGFSWTTGDQDTLYTNWKGEDSPSMCSVPRCVVMGYNTLDPVDNFKWLDGSCSVPVDGYLCHYADKGMCPALWGEGAGNALYSTPFNLLSTLLTHVPFGSVATVPCPTGAKEEQSVLCMLRDDGSVGWSREPPLCSDFPIVHNWCEQGNGGCEHFCRQTGGHFYCECANGYQLGGDGQSCELLDICHGAQCEFECLPLSDSYRCACPDGYMLATDERSCLDVDECLHSPCEHLCENTLGSFQCRCPDGYLLDEEGVCEDIDECINDPCEHACENTLGSHICHCNLGYSLMPDDSSHCQDTDECQIPGTCEQMCVNYEGGFQCDCKDGFELMSDHFSCQERREGDFHATVTPPFPWVSHQPEPAWIPVDLEWNPEQSHTGWTTEEEQTLDWLTDPPTVLKPDVIWVTRTPQEEIPFDSKLDGLKVGTDKDEKDVNEDDLLEWEQELQFEVKVSSTEPSPYPLVTSASTPTLEWYEDDEETTTPLPSVSTSTVSEGAWHWWAGIPTSSQNPGNEEDLVTDYIVSTDSNIHTLEEEDQKSFLFPEEELGEGEGDDTEVTHSQGSAVPTQFPFSLSPVGKGVLSVDNLDSIEEDRGEKQSSTWLLVGLLVPICIFIILMVVLGIVYYTRCTVQPRNKNATDCYHWISGAHDKQGAPNSSAGIKTNV